MGLYPARSMERAMKFQEVILRAMSKQITWIQAAEILGMSDRNMRRYRNRLEKGGYDGLIDRRTQRPSPKRVPLTDAQAVLTLYREQYFDFNVKHFHEKLRDEHDISLSYTWVKNALQQAGLVARTRKRGRHHKRRPRRPLPGMMLHIDGSTHAWLGADHERFDLVTLMDDATSEIYYARFVDEESTESIMAGVLATIETQGVFCSLYSDRASHLHAEGSNQA
jgi:transposase